MIPVAIGILTLVLQPTCGQATDAGLFRVPDGDTAWLKWIDEASRSGPEGWHRIWRVCDDMGACVAPAVGRALASERKRERRLVLAGAYAVASRRPQGVLLERRNGDRMNRVMALFAVAMGPRQDGDGDRLGLRLKRATPIEQVAGCLALSRFKARGALPDVVLDKTRDPGVLAAALYCRPASTRAWIQARVRRIGAPSFEHLVWRGYLLGERCTEEAGRDRLALAREILRGDCVLTAARAAKREAAWCLAHHPGAQLEDEVLRRQSLSVRTLLGGAPSFARRILDGTGTEFSLTVNDETLRRWAVLFARRAPIEKLKSALSRWRTDLAFGNVQGLRNAVTLAVSWRLAGLDRSVGRSLALDVTALKDSKYEPWLAWLLAKAPGAKVLQEKVEFADPQLTRAFELAVAGKLSRAGIASQLQAALWRRGDHPGLTGLDLHRQFLGEVLIDGSGLAGTKFARARQNPPYTAKGLERESKFFHVAYELFKFIHAEERRLMPEYRRMN